MFPIRKKLRQHGNNANISLELLNLLYKQAWKLNTKPDTKFPVRLLV